MGWYNIVVWWFGGLDTLVEVWLLGYLWTRWCFRVTVNWWLCCGLELLIAVVLGGYVVVWVSGLGLPGLRLWRRRPVLVVSGWFWVVWVFSCLWWFGMGFWVLDMVVWDGL